MFLYRLCKEEEALKILETKRIATIGRYCINNLKLNTHIYEKNQKYLHFFLEEYAITNLNPSKGKYICTYNLPIYLVDKYQGFGYYRSVFDLDTTVKIPECAIPSQLISFTDLIKIEKIKEYLDFELYLDDIDKYKEVIYPKETNTKIRRKYD